MSHAYTQAGKVLQMVHAHKVSLKNALLTTGDKPATLRKVYALVFETLKWKSVLASVVAAVPEVARASMFKNERSRWVAYVALYDLLFGKKKIEGGGKVKKLLMGSKSRLSTALARIKIKAKAKSDIDLLPEHIRCMPLIPRYARVNTLIASVDLVLEHYTTLAVDPFVEVSLDVAMAAWMAKSDEGKRMVARDDILSDMLVYLGGGIILQDKASCFPAALLAPPPHASVIDACAAPGNKTSHLVARMGGDGRVIAFDKSRTRMATLRKLTARAHAADTIDSRVGNFLEASLTDPDLAAVTHLLVDPSCSGSGIVSRQDALVGPLTTDKPRRKPVPGPKGAGDDSDDDSDEEEGTDPGVQEAGHIDVVASTAHEDDNEGQRRLEALAAFQIEAMQHAMSFPAARRITYSTCSIHVTENEAVVHTLLEWGASRGWRLAEPDGELAAWARRGDPNAWRACPVATAAAATATAAGSASSQASLSGADLLAQLMGTSSAPASKPAAPTSAAPLPASTGCSLCDDIAARVIRTDPAADHTIGFFVALFERDDPDPSASAARKRKRQSEPIPVPANPPQANKIEPSTKKQKSNIKGQAKGKSKGKAKKIKNKQNVL
ncbi:NSUN5 protein [Thecamonas trahens ATCC 50062]|uniref:NSUN5 protein n=1 Tax=Thecamonas trahens ATCC 50062 TaxID=461836 RepID=A0A0L0D9Y7_THETB|nr:NSUN5 protein [Thecamonas trahens ATCC 50062]KNC49177.1 NSUN5 protein [Thecamonas trahens ATCC 50062]|eukprot:XP_013758197.1 NSUN5 protein [Thecamonas trahens ATCC 50062]